jgi:hypothetical protein
LELLGGQGSVQNKKIEKKLEKVMKKIEKKRP